MFTSLARENLALTLSAVGAGLFALAGITWGLWVDSLVIIFDGAYSLISLGLSLLSLYAARLVRRVFVKVDPLERAGAVARRDASARRARGRSDGIVIEGLVLSERQVGQHEVRVAAVDAAWPVKMCGNRSAKQT